MRKIITFAAAMTGLALMAPPIPAFAQSNEVAPASDIDSARAAAAERVANAIVPDGTMVRLADIMAEMMNGQIMDSMFAGMDSMSAADVLAPYGVEYGDKDLAALKKVPFRELMLALDPYFEQRMKLLFTALTERMKPIYVQMEPGIRHGLMQSLAKDYSTAELDQIGAFAATPAGKQFTANILMLFAKPEVMGEMQKSMPEMMKQMPDIMGDIKSSMEQYPDSKADPAATKQRIDTLLEKYRDQ